MAKYPFYTKLAHVLVSLIAIVYISIIGQTVLEPLAFALLFALLLLPFAGWLERKLKFPRSLAAMTALIGSGLIVGSLLFVLLGQLSDLATDFPAFQAQLLQAVNEIQTWVAQTFHIDNSAQIKYINEAANGALGKGTVVLGTMLLSFSSLLMFLVFTFLYALFILIYRRLLYNAVAGLFDDSHSETVSDAVNQIRHVVKRYVSGLFFQMLIVSILACTVFSCIGIKYAMLLGLIAGIFNIIPYIGIFSALLLASLVTFATGTPADVLWVVIAVVIIHAIDSNIVMPKVVGSQVKINPLMALLALVIGEMIWGIKGMFLSIPILAVLKIVFDRVDGLKAWAAFFGEEEIGK
ncbi:AI-2E family transporter [Flavobacterium silvaticum]|uniref:AI-2E family transporter n=1 Tax=Flavobacterium silvaticum TaxID=1852020 RepID=A0A972JIY2_9FLAO|nr:AI-2E family transporter [Flavobacterium silvaticum]NMH28783.1 AI-2E family transporter [Flavobacterium silvaticum]